jgi:cytoskeletal protein CcmA (bactofilin family)
MESASTIGRGTVVRGSVHGDGDLEILGRVEGSVAVTGELAIGELALVKSDVSGRRVTVQGAVSGNVSATEAIVLLAGARVVGDLAAPQIGIRPGALVRGMVSTGAPGAAAPVAHAKPAAHAAPRAAAQRVVPAAPAAPRAPARPAPAPRAAAQPARPAPAAPVHASPRVEAPAHASPRVEARSAPPSEPEAGVGEATGDDEVELVEQVAQGGASHGGAPPPVVPQIRKGAKASLRRKGPR